MIRKVVVSEVMVDGTELDTVFKYTLNGGIYTVSVNNNSFDIDNNSMSHFVEMVENRKLDIPEYKDHNRNIVYSNDSLHVEMEYGYDLQNGTYTFYVGNTSFEIESEAVPYFLTLLKDRQLPNA